MTLLRVGVLLRGVFLPLGLFVIFFSFHHVMLNSYPNIKWFSKMNLIESESRNESSEYFATTHIADRQQNEDKPPCFKSVPTRRIKLMINTTLPTDQELNQLFPHIQMGGHWQPDHCQPRQRLGIFIPMRKRWHQLPILLRHLHKLLVPQWRHYTIFVIEQAEEEPFNRGKLLNAGILEALKILSDLNCFILHDVDTLPETNLAIYKCHEDRRFTLQMSTYQKKRNYKTAYKGYTGGVLAIRRSQFEDINGFSNEFWGWGGEDDDLGNRLNNKSYQVKRELSPGGYFYSLDHPLASANPQREDIVEKHKGNLHREGLDSVDYVVLNNERRRLYTFFSVSLSPQDEITLPSAPHRKYIPRP